MYSRRKSSSLELLVRFQDTLFKSFHMIIYVIYESEFLWVYYLRGPKLEFIKIIFFVVVGITFFLLYRQKKNSERYNQIIYNDEKLVYRTKTNLTEKMSHLMTRNSC